MLLSQRSETKLYWTLIIAAYGLKILGLAPFSLRVKASAENSRNVDGFRCSKLGLAYNILLSILVQIATAFAMRNCLNLSYSVDPIGQAIDITLIVVGWLSMSVILIFSAFRQKTAVRVINRLLEIDRVLSGIESRPLSNKKMFIFLALHIIFTAALWTTSRTTELFPPSAPWILLVFYTGSNCMLYSYATEYFFVAVLVAREIERVNDNLSELKEFPSHLSSMSFVNDYTAVLNSSTKSRIFPLELLIAIRTAVYEVSKDVADFFSFPILLSIGYFLFVIVCDVQYITYLIFVEKGEFLLIKVLNTLTWLLIAAYPITLLSLSVSKMTKQAKLTGRIVHELLATATIQKIKEELREFSLQLLHENLVFTAYGFFALDCTMLLSMMGATATYTVILIQFSASADTPNDT